MNEMHCCQVSACIMRRMAEFFIKPVLFFPLHRQKHVYTRLEAGGHYYFVEKSLYSG